MNVRMKTVILIAGILVGIAAMVVAISAHTPVI
jgi:hypothetical protein